jgi:nucleotide-binding universal stress UspA family protein
MTGVNQKKEIDMYDRILVATDGSTLSKQAVTSAISLAALSGAELYVLKVIPRYPQSYFEGSIPVSVDDVAKIETGWANNAQAIVDKVKSQAEAKGIKTKTVISKSDFVGEAIIAAAKKNKADLIVMASHGRKGLKRLLMGSETLNVLTHSHIPVLVLR